MIVKKKFFITGPKQNIVSLLNWMISRNDNNKNVLFKTYKSEHTNVFVLITETNIIFEPNKSDTSNRKDIKRYNVCRHLSTIKDLLK